MIFDSEEQKQKVIDLIGEAPVNTTIKGVLSGPSPALMDLMERMVNAHILSVDDQTVLMIENEQRKRGDLSDD
jgi:hypothetical protein